MLVCVNESVVIDPHSQLALIVRVEGSHVLGQDFPRWTHVANKDESEQFGTLSTLKEGRVLDVESEEFRIWGV